MMGTATHLVAGGKRVCGSNMIRAHETTARRKVRCGAFDKVMAASPVGLADDFAADWYARQDSECDEETLAALLDALLRDAFALGEKYQRGVTREKLPKGLGLG